MGSIRRRGLLKAIPSLGLLAVAGCSGEDSGVTDTDGDGVIDSQDYAPKDAAVQEKADLQTSVAKTTTPTPATETSTQTTRSTPTATPTATTTTTSTTTRTPDANTIQVNAADFRTQNARFTEYGVEAAGVWVHPDAPSVSESDYRELWVFAMSYPRGGGYFAKGHTTVDLSGGGDEYGVSLDWDRKPTNEPVFFGAVLAESGVSWGDLAASNSTYLHETDAFEIHSDGATISRAHVSALQGVDSASVDGYERTPREGEIALSFTGRTNGQEWETNFVVYKSAYVSAVSRDHGRRRSEFVAYEMSSGFSGELAQILSEEADANNFSGKRAKVEFIVDFVQYLPYVPDDVSTPYDDYTKYGAETLCELGGDCEDTAIMLASVLQSAPFDYDTILIQPPEHMAVGVYGADDLPGYYWEVEGRQYYYIETTGVGWGIGDLPDAYKDASAYVIQV